MRSRRFLWAAAFSVGLFTGPAAVSRERIPGPAIFGDSTSRQIVFPADFSFPFGGVRYKSCFVTSNGLICFHAATTTAPTTASTPLTFLGERPRIAPLWVDLNPGSGGSSPPAGPGRARSRSAGRTCRWRGTRPAGTRSAASCTATGPSISSTARSIPTPGRRAPPASSASRPATRTRAAPGCSPTSPRRPSVRRAREPLPALHAGR